MVLSKMNNHEHGTRQTYESYTFQPLMSFCLYLKSGVPQFTLQFDFLETFEGRIKQVECKNCSKFKSFIKKTKKITFLQTGARFFRTGSRSNVKSTFH